MKNFLGLVTLIAMDNSMGMLPYDQCKFCDDSGIDWKKMDSDAAKLSLEEAKTLCCGEQSEALEIEKKHGLQDLAKVLDQVFDGYLYDHFFHPWP